MSAGRRPHPNLVNTRSDSGPRKTSMMYLPQNTRTLLSIAVFYGLLLNVPVMGQTPVNYDNLSDEAISNWGQSEHVFQAKLTVVQPGPVARSFPPIYNYRLTLQVTATMRGTTPTGKPITLFYSARQKTPPTFPEGKLCLSVLGKVCRLLPSTCRDPVRPCRFTDDSHKKPW